MSETKDQSTPTADDIVDDLAEEMGVDDEETSHVEEDDVEEDDVDDEGEQEASDGDDEEDDVEDKKMAGLDGVFSVAKSGKKKKKKKKKKKTTEKKKEKKAKKAKPEGVELFTPEKEDNVDLEALAMDLDDDLPAQNPVNKMLVAIIIILIVAFGAVAIIVLDDPEEGEPGFVEKVGLILRGEYQDHMEARVAEREEAHRQAQLAKVPRYGNLRFTGGRPAGGLIKLNGEVQYAQPEGEDYWREIRLMPGQTIENLSIDEIHELEIIHPGHQVFVRSVTENDWETHGMDYVYDLSVTLRTESDEAASEFNHRMDTSAGQGPFFGVVRVHSNPPGARIKINGRIARDEDGQPLVTPTTLDTFYTYNIDLEELDGQGLLDDMITDEELFEELGGVEHADYRRLGLDKSGLTPRIVELRERQMQVDTPPRGGDSVRIIPADDELPTYATMLTRAMWECQWKEQSERDRLPSDAPIQDHCNYVFDFDMDFEELAAYIERREAERERIEAQRREAGIQDVEVDPDEQT